MTENPYSSPSASSAPRSLAASDHDHRSWSATARRVVRVLSIVAAAIFMVLDITGAVPTLFRVSSAPLHKWSAHVLVISLWLFVPFSVVVGLLMNLRRRPGLAIAQTMVLSSLLVLVLLASFTGYLAPSNATGISEETRNRFTVLHQYALPTLIATLLIAWNWLFRPHNPSAPGSDTDADRP